MDELNFQKLTPTQEVDLSGYEDAFHYIFDEDDIRNIAISGAYSSGKSSVIESYKKKHPEKKFLHLSLAHFQALDDAQLNDDFSDGNIGGDKQKDSESILEGKILNQLIQQIPADKIPQTNFRIKRSVDWKKPAITSSMLCLLVVLLLHCTRFDAWKSTIDALNDGWMKNVLSITTVPDARIFSLLLSLIVVGIGVFKQFTVTSTFNLH